MNESEAAQQQMNAWQAVFDKVCKLSGGYGALSERHPQECGREMILRGIQELADREPAWVDATKRLPADDDLNEVLFYSPQSGLPVDTHVGVHVEGLGWFSCGLHVQKVTHWKRKPLPPQ